MRALFLLIVVVLTGGAILIAMPAVERLLTDPRVVDVPAPKAKPVEAPQATYLGTEGKLVTEAPAAEIPDPEELSAEADKVEAAPIEVAPIEAQISPEEIFKAPERDDKLFPLPVSLGPAVAFWTRIYSDVDTRGGLIHDNQRMDVVYSMLDLSFDPMPEKTIERNIAYYRHLLWELAKGKRQDLNCDEQRALLIWGEDSGALKAAAERVRFQRGQSNRFLVGLNRSAAWRPYILKTLDDRGLPRELAALPHVESSFHPRVTSHAGAAGLWQFMPGTGRRFMRIDEVLDERFDPFKASEGAAQLLQYNHSILDSWPLALTAYNHGLGGVYGLTKRFSTKDIGEIVARSKGKKGLGFASRNFYASFLAALEVSDHPGRYFRSLHPRQPAEPAQLELNAFLPVDSLAQALGLEKEELQKLNPVLQSPVWSGSKYVPKGYSVVLPPAYEMAGVSEKLRLAEKQFGFDQQKPDLFHKIKPGDTLSTIAEKYGVGTAELMALNQLGKKSRIRAGQTLKLPGKRVATPVALAQVAAAEGPPVADEIKSPQAEPDAARDSGQVGAVPVPATIEAQKAVETPVPTQVAQAEMGQGDGAGVNPAADGSEAPSEPAPDSPEMAVEDLPAQAETAEAGAEPGTPSPTEPNTLVSGQAAQPPNTPAPAKILIAEGKTAEAAGQETAATGQKAPEGDGEVRSEEDRQMSADPSDYRVAADGTIVIQPPETLGHYATWLEVSVARLKKANGRGFSLKIGHRMHLALGRVSRKIFEERRLAFHESLQSSFFDRYRITTTREHRIGDGDSLWWLAIKRYNLPLWLLRQYNPDLEIEGTLPRGTVVKIPVVKKIADQPSRNEVKSTQRVEKGKRARRSSRFDLKTSIFRPVPGRT
ncbi:MAG: transglycosylase SLT domain-containing protein [Gammaproteobacteria bacterium]|nr:transglycosylase SLT domain-containing protein [Gammaproteobacteria bacterium]MBU1655128.1 transglycosylase SLT domain-containing protein [Gammaproteobacteria bacterium]MBU1961600.1 transglycosylase SLT domain-containing protein [Gammaproteobacteria bacterium]